MAAFGRTIQPWNRFGFIAALILAIAVTATVSIVLLQDYSANQYRLSLEASNLGLDTYHVNDRAWVAATAAIPDNPANNAIAPDVALQDFDDFLQRYRNRIGHAPAELHEPAASFLAIVEAANASLHNQQPFAAVGVMNGSHPGLYSTEALIDEVAHRYATRAERVKTWTTVGSVAVLSMTLAGIGFVLWAYRKAQLHNERERAHQEVLRRSEARLRSLIQNSASVITVIDPGGTIQYQGSTVRAILGYEPEELLESQYLEVVHAEDRQRVEALIAQISADEKGTTHMLECRLQDRSGHWLEIELTGQNLTRDPDVRGLVLTARDIGERKALENRLAHQALHDALTGLPNRTLFRERLQHALERGVSADRCHAVVFLDIDDFKVVNDSLGHIAGDGFLIAVADRLRRNVRTGDTVSRFGGDEFAVLIENTTEDEVESICERFLKAFTEPFHVAERTLQATASLGVLSVNEPGRRAEELLRDADTAMYIAKARGKGRYEVFTPAMHAAVVDRLDLEAEMRTGLLKDQFAVFYQPLIDVSSKSIVGLEALLRWNHPTRGLLLPETFIPVAEESGLILPLGALALRQACHAAREWQNRYPSSPPMFMTVNLSARQLLDAYLVDEVRRALEDSGLDPGSLILEITETVLVQNTASTQRRLAALRELGVQLAVDDFGTGYSSLSYLQDFPVDIVKVDKSFIDRLKFADSSAVQDAIVALAHALNLKTVAEGVEKAEQLDRLTLIGFDLWQGFYFAEPMAGTSVESLLSGDRTQPETGQQTKVA